MDTSVTLGLIGHMIDCLGLKALERMLLSNNELTAIPSGINCPKLESLLINANQITEIPPDLPLWPTLKVLFINQNALKVLPETFMQNTWIERINLSRNNKVTAPSKHVLAHLKKVCEENKGKYWPPDTL